MALSSTANIVFNTDAQPVSPVSITSAWQLAIASNAAGFAGTAAASGGPEATADAATITNPTTEIITDTRRILNRGQRGGTHIVLSLRYPTAVTISTPLKVAVFGRYASGDQWMRLTSKSGNNSATFDDLSTDVSDGTYKYTYVNQDDHIFDMKGCVEILIGSEQAVALSSGSGTTTALYAKII